MMLPNIRRLIDIQGQPSECVKNTEVGLRLEAPGGAVHVDGVVLGLALELAVVVASS